MRKQQEFLRGRNFGVMVRMCAIWLGVSIGTAVGLCQGISGRLAGTVTDTTGAVVANAQITIKNPETGVTARNTTAKNGEYRFEDLPPGIYRVQVEAQGFHPMVLEHNVVSVDNTTVVNAQLSVGAATETVVVSENSQLIDTTTASMGETLGGKELSSLPLNGRIFSQLIQTIPGSVATGFENESESGSGVGAQSAITASVNGLPWQGTTYTLDGVSNMELLNAFMNVTPPMDALQEVKISTNNADTNVGTYGGAQVNSFIKSGTNEFHGSAFEYARNSVLQATPWATVSKAPYSGNQFGGSLGGPILKNHLFFFGDYQGNRISNGTQDQLSVPTDLMRQGYFLTSQFQPIYDPQTQAPFPIVSTTQGQAYQIPTSRFDAVAAKVVTNAIFPEPTISNQVGNNWKRNVSAPDSVDSFDAKVDYQITPNDRIFARESYQRRNLVVPYAGTRYMLTFSVNSQPRDHNAVVAYDHVFSPQMQNSLRFGFNRFYTLDFGNDYNTNENTTLGIKNGNLAAYPGSSGIATFNFGFFSGGVSSTGSMGWTNAHRITNIYEITDNLFKQNGKNAFTFGADYRRLQASLTNPDASEAGEFDFNGNMTSSCTGQSATCNVGFPGSGTPFADFLLGYPSSIERDFVNTDPATRINLVGIYAQDDVRITRNLSASLALRWDLETNPVDKFNRQSNFDLKTGLIDFAVNGNRVPNVDNNLKNFAPRVGLAYSLNNGKTVLRAAFGMTHFPDHYGAVGGTLERNYPWFDEYAWSRQTPYSQSDPTLGTVTVAGTGLPLPNAMPASGVTSAAPPNNTSVYFMARNFQPDASNTWNVGVEQQLGSSSTLHVAYVGTKGTHLFRNVNINTPQTLAAGAINPRRPYYGVAPGVTTINSRQSDGNSIYHALQVEYNVRMSRSLMGRFSYTWSKEIDDLNVIWPWNDRMNRMVGNQSVPDTPHNFAGNLVFPLPFGKGQRFLGNSTGPTEWLLGNWQVSSIAMIHSGGSLIMTNSTDLQNTGGTNLLTQTCSRMSKTTGEWFDTSCFAPATPLTFGVERYGSIRGPGYANWDASVSKSEKIHERNTITISADIFNTLNTPHYGNPSTTYGFNPFGGSFGQITSPVGTPREIQLGAHYTF